MNYKKIYDNLIFRAKSENRIKNDGVYYESHHIIPKCLGGTGTEKQWKNHPNIVLLTAKEHYIAHRLLVDIYPDNKSLILSYHLFVFGHMKKNHNDKEYFKISSREYEQRKIIHSKIKSEQLSYNNPMHNPETVKKLVNNRKKNESYKKDDKWRKKISKSLKGKITWMEGNKNGSGKWGTMTKNIILNLETGIYYNAREVSELTGYDKGYLIRKLNNKKNKTSFKIV